MTKLSIKVLFIAMLWVIPYGIACMHTHMLWITLNGPFMWLMLYWFLLKQLSAT